MTYKSINFNSIPLWNIDESKGKNLIRTDYHTYPRVNQLYEAVLGRFWRHTDFTYTKDAIDYSKLTPAERDLFDTNFLIQTLGDAAVSRGAHELFIPLTDHPDLELWFNYFTFTEANIHSAAYSAVLKIIKPNASEELDSLMENEDLLAIIKPIDRVFNELYNHDKEDKDGLKQKLVRALHAQYVLESMIFQNSFLITFAFNERGLMRNNSKMIQSIYHDELVHIAFDKYIIKETEYTAEVTDIYEEVYQLMKQHISRLPQTGIISTDLLHEFNDYITHRTMVQVGLKPITDKSTNPILWWSKYSVSKDLQEALQETEKTSYLIAKVNKANSYNDTMMKRYNASN